MSWSNLEECRFVLSWRCGTDELERLWSEADAEPEVWAWEDDPALAAGE